MSQPSSDSGNAFGKEEEDQESEANITKRKLEQKIAELENVIKEKENEIKEKDNEIKEKDKYAEKIKIEKENVIKEKDNEIKEKDNEIKEKDKYAKKIKIEKENLENKLRTVEAEKEAVSLYAVIAGQGIPPLTCEGSSFSHLNPKNHKAASMVTKKVDVSKTLIKSLEQLQKDTKEDTNEDTKEDSKDEHAKNILDQANNDLDEEKKIFLIAKLKKDNSILMSKINSVKQKPTISNEAEVAFYVNLALTDAVSICNMIIESIDPKETSVHLIVRQEMNIFSNRCDHTVVYKNTKNAPIFCVETKKHFDECWRTVPNQVLGQCFDQLKEMQAFGHPNPLGALTSFNETYLTSLNADIDWDKQPTFNSIGAIWSLLPGTSQPNGTPPPLKVESPSDDISTSFTFKFERNDERTIYRSEHSIDQNNLVSALVVVILQALEVSYVPTLRQQYKQNQIIQRHCIQMTTEDYQWGELSTLFRGSVCSERKHWEETPLFLLNHIGSGSTSKAYYAVTEDGYDCVVKIYVQSQNENGSFKTEKEFKEDSEKHVNQEKENYTRIYGKDLEDYVHVRTLNGFSCLIMPFFDPISVDDRRNKSVQDDIKSRLQQFANEKLAFNDCDVKWRHIGQFNDKIYLFDLADLVTYKNDDEAQKTAHDHFEILKKEQVS